MASTNGSELLTGNIALSDQSPGLFCDISCQKMLPTPFSELWSVRRTVAPSTVRNWVKLWRGKAPQLLLAAEVRLVDFIFGSFFYRKTVWHKGWNSEFIFCFSCPVLHTHPTPTTLHLSCFLHIHPQWNLRCTSKKTSLYLAPVTILKLGYLLLWKLIFLSLRGRHTHIHTEAVTESSHSLVYSPNTCNLQAGLSA